MANAPAAAPAPAIAYDRAGVGLPWLVRLRWGAIVLEVLAVALAGALGAPSRAPWRVLACVGVTAATNVLLARQPRLAGASAEALGGLALALDVVLFTVILQATGGVSNPFSVLYLVYITLAAVVLGAAWTWGIASLAVLCFGALFFVSEVSGAHAGAHGPELLLHLRGMWMAFALAAALTAYFVVKLSAALEHRDQELAAMREHAARIDRLAALTTLAAGAAHELGTPLGTIAVAVGELEHAVRRLPPRHASALEEDTRLIRSELARCRRILDQMSADAGEPAGEAVGPVPVTALVGDVLASLPGAEAARIDVAPLPELCVTVPRRALAQAVTSLVRNALDATAGGGSVAVAVTADAAAVRLVVRDDGPGMAPGVLAHAVEPFYSTKPTGRGLGLGLFLTRALLERLGGRLVLESRSGAGTTAAIELPVELVAARSASA